MRHLFLTVIVLFSWCDITWAKGEFGTEPSVPIPNDPVDRKVYNFKQSGQKWLEVRLKTQRLIAWQGNKQVYAVIVSTGKPVSPTPVGSFAVQSMHRYARMQGDDYDVPDVPHTMYYDGNYAIHGAYWHHRFGTPVSHGCINVAPDHAGWFFRWSQLGTPVLVHKK